MSATELRLISWNIAGRVKTNPQQMAALKARGPDLLALQEVRLNALGRIEPLLAAMGLPHSIESVHLAAERGMRYGEIIASRWPLKLLPAILEGFDYPERVLSALVDTPWGSVTLHTVHVIPGVGNCWKKVEMFERIYSSLHASGGPRILCGDFNSPQQETPEGRVITWGEEIRSNGNVEIAAGYERWDAGERSILQGLADFDLLDVFRALNGYGGDAYSWAQRTKYRVTKRRFDHVFASRALNATECRYLTDLAEAGLSDHAAIEAVFRPS